MNTEPVHLTSAELAARLLPDGTQKEHSVVSSILEKIARRHAERGGRAPVIDRGALLAELQVLNLGDGERALLTRGLELAILQCTWSPPSFDASAPGFKVLMLLFLTRPA